jgi:hypothetical protein
MLRPPFKSLCMVLDYLERPGLNLIEYSTGTINISHNRNEDLMHQRRGSKEKATMPIILKP